MNNYNPEIYWSEVAGRIKSREEKNIIAGDDEPYYQYKRKKLINLLNTIDFEKMSVLEIGCGPGGNLIEIIKRSPSNLVAVNISNDMVELAKNNTLNTIKILKIDGETLPFSDSEFDIVFSVTVLQHNTDEEKLRKLISEICRVSKKKIYLFERIEKKIKGNIFNYGRPVSYYNKLCNAYGFYLTSTQYINIQVSYFISGAIRKVLNRRTRKEGEPLNRFSLILQKATLPITKLLDKVFKSKRDVAKMEFVRM